MSYLFFVKLGVMHFLKDTVYRSLSEGYCVLYSNKTVKPSTRKDEQGRKNSFSLSQREKDP